MTVAPRSHSAQKLPCGYFVVCRTTLGVVKAVVPWEETGKCTEETLRGKGPSTHVRILEVTPGRTIIQHWLAATCKDSLVVAKAEANERDLVWRMSQYEL